MVFPTFALFTLLAKLSAANPCDIYDTHGTPCVAAHSSTRALYNLFKNSLYQVKRNSDNKTIDVRPIAPGGVADAASQDKFCAGTTCLITTIYDQSGNGNDLTQAPPGGAASGPQPGGYDLIASATGAVVQVGGKKAYGIFNNQDTGYRNDNTSNVAIGNEPQGIYAVVDGTHYNDFCCFDYGNAETDNRDPGATAMEALYFGSLKGTVHGPGNGPWIQADLENGLFGGGALNEPHDNLNPNNPSIDYRFVTAILKGNDTNWWALRGGDATTGNLSTLYEGTRPTGYFPMKKQGAIVLGVGGDNSNWAVGTFYEGAILKGYPTDAAEAAVQADIVAAGYNASSEISGAGIPLKSTIKLQNVATGHYLGLKGHDVTLHPDKGSNATSFRAIAALRPNAEGCLSFESISTPGAFLRHSGYQLFADDSSGKVRPGVTSYDASFCPEEGFAQNAIHSFRSWDAPTRYFRALDNGTVFIGAQGGPFPQDSWENFNVQASWKVEVVSKNCQRR